MAVPTDRESDKFVLRLPNGMRDRIKSAADQNNRSMNAEIVAALEAAFPVPNQLRATVLHLAYLAESYPAMQNDPKLRQEMKDAISALTDQLTALVEGTGSKP